MRTLHPVVCVGGHPARIPLEPSNAPIRGRQGRRREDVSYVCHDCRSPSGVRSSQSLLSFRLPASLTLFNRAFDSEWNADVNIRRTLYITMLLIHVHLLHHHIPLRYDAFDSRMVNVGLTLPESPNKMIVYWPSSTHGTVTSTQPRRGSKSFARKTKRV
jgi:hypothetical protein